MQRHCESRKREVGRRLRSLYSAQEEEKKAKKIKTIDPPKLSIHKNHYTSSSSGSSSGRRPQSRAMAKCLKEMKKSPSHSSKWKTTGPSTSTSSTSSSLRKPGL
eukprot:TRINITY_DN2228_c0_g1_i2.p1 TRINITY_DN2228_c0_g1~~TRINITY_DN2228_c0_g1_i2.p1  ORF type:complete len:104 (-),score=28.64 TRINITY_DN2228_c0_g1_i2:21-332(-)